MNTEYMVLWNIIEYYSNRDTLTELQQAILESAKAQWEIVKEARREQWHKAHPPARND
jgi:hypothetical protein